MLTRSRLLVAASAVIVAAPLVLAADDAPTFDHLNKDQVKKGATTPMMAAGTNFGDKKDDVTVDAGGTPCNVTLVMPKSINFLLPGTLPLGPATITIKVKGKTFQAKITVVDKIQRRAEDAAEGPGAGGSGAERMKADASGLLQTQLTLQGGENASAIVEGTTQIPAGLTLEAQLVLAGMNGEQDYVVETKQFKIAKPQLHVQFGPYPGKSFCAGKYFCVIEFYHSRQGFLELKAAKWDKPDAVQKRIWAHIWSRDTKDAGSPADAKKEHAETTAHYKDLAAQTEKLVDEIEKAYAAAGKSYFKKSSGYDEKAWTDWVHERQLGQTDDELKKLESDHRFLRGSYFNPDAWQGWVEKDVFAKLLDARKMHQALHDKYVGVAHAKLDEAGFELISIAGKLVQNYSVEIYGRSKVEVPESIRNPKDLFTGHEAPTASRGEFDSKKKLMLERVQLLAPPAPPAKAGGSK